MCSVLSLCFGLAESSQPIFIGAYTTLSTPPPYEGLSNMVHFSHIDVDCTFVVLAVLNVKDGYFLNHATFINASYVWSFQYLGALSGAPFPPLPSTPHGGKW